MAFRETTKVAKGGEGGKAGVTVSDGFVGVLCAASIYRLHHLYQLFLVSADGRLRNKKLEY
jgi:hypothetical protein